MTKQNKDVKKYEEGIKLAIIVIIIFLASFFLMQVSENIHRERERQNQKVCAGHTIEEAIAYNECPLQRFAYIVYNPQANVNDLICRCPTPEEVRG